MANLKIEYIKLSKLIPHAQNSRTHSDKQIEQIAESIKEFGFTNPVLVDEVNGIIAGHGRVLGADLVGMEEAPCIRLSHLSERQKRAYIIADNKIATSSGWDFEKLAEELDYLSTSDYDLDLTGFNEQEIDALLKNDKSILPEGLEPEDVTKTVVAQHERIVGAEKKARGFSWQIIVEADSKADAKRKHDLLTKQGYTCVMLKNAGGDSID